MPILASGRQYALGRDCTLTVDGSELRYVTDVLVRESVASIDATGFNHKTSSSVVTGRTLEVEVSTPELQTAQFLRTRRVVERDGYVLPAIVTVSLAGGAISFFGKRFTIAEIQADEPLDNAVLSRFSLTEWGGAARDEVPPQPNDAAPAT